MAIEMGASGVITLVSQTLGNAITFACWFSSATQGATNSGRMFAHGPVGSFRFRAGWNGTAASQKLNFLSGRATTNGRWDMTTAFDNMTSPAPFAAPFWKFFAVSYDGTFTSGDPTVYVWEEYGTTYPVLTMLTVGSGLTEVNTPSGALNADNQTFRIGAASDGTSGFDGDGGEFGLWTSALSAAEVASVFSNGVLSVTQPHLYWPVDRIIGSSVSFRDYSGNARNGTSGADVAEDMPPIRPCGRRG